MGMFENNFQSVKSYIMDANAGHVNGYIREAVVCMHITWILYQTELGLRGLRANRKSAIMKHV